MGENGYPIYFSMKEIEKLYRNKKITFKELMVYKHCPHKIPVKRYEMLTDTSTKTI